jgi:hypothetical protein
MLGERRVDLLLAGGSGLRGRMRRLRAQPLGLRCGCVCLRGGEVACRFVGDARCHASTLITVPGSSGCFLAASSCCHQRSIEFSAAASARSTAGMSGRMGGAGLLAANVSGA